MFTVSVTVTVTASVTITVNVTKCAQDAEALVTVTSMLEIKLWSTKKNQKLPSA
jgi:hypothetical protein